MSSVRQIAANRLNALKSTGPRSEEGKQGSRRNAVRHGLTAETVIAYLEDAEDYQAFEEAVSSGFDPSTAVDRELILRLASVLWRLRRAGRIERELFDGELSKAAEKGQSVQDPELDTADLFLALLELPGKPMDRLTKYEAMLWRQARQILAQLHVPERRKWARPSRAALL